MSENISEKDESLFELLFKNGLNAEGKRLWEAIISNSAVVVERDSFLIVLLIESYQDFIYLKKQLKSKKPDFAAARVKENTNGTQQEGWAVKQMNDKAKIILQLTKELGLSAMSAKELKALEASDADMIASLLKSDR